MIKWLDKALTDAVSVLGDEADLQNTAERALIAQSVIDSLPKNVIIDAIRDATATVLKQRGIADASNDLAREIANNAAHSVCVWLEVPAADEEAA